MRRDLFPVFVECLCLEALVCWQVSADLVPWKAKRCFWIFTLHYLFIYYFHQNSTWFKLLTKSSSQASSSESSSIIGSILIVATLHEVFYFQIKLCSVQIFYTADPVGCAPAGSNFRQAWLTHVGWFLQDINLFWFVCPAFQPIASIQRSWTENNRNRSSFNY